jgi:hypothetical protein
VLLKIALYEKTSKKTGFQKDNSSSTGKRPPKRPEYR